MKQIKFCKRLFWLVLAAGFLFSFYCWANDYQSKFGAFKVNFPSGWVVNEKDSGKAVIAVNTAEKKTVSINIIVKSLPIEIYNNDLRQYLTAQKMVKDWNQIKESGEDELDKESAIWVKELSIHKTKGNNIWVKSLQMWAVHGDKLFAITAMAIDPDQAKANDKFSLYESQFKKTITSLKFTDWEKIKKASPKRKGFMQTLFWFFLILLAELAVPFVIRYIIAGKPLSWSASLIIIAVLFVLNILIFKALGSKAIFHPMYFVIALISYPILHKGFSKDE